MDPSHGAYNRIRQFLADLNVVLGSTSYATTDGPAPNFDQIACPQTFALGGPHQRPWSNRPTKRSRAWKMSHQQKNCDRWERAPHPYTVRFPPSRQQVQPIVYNRCDRYKPPKFSVRYTQHPSRHQHRSFPCPYKQEPGSTEDLQREGNGAEHLDQELNSTLDDPSNVNEESLLSELASNEMITDKDFDCHSAISIGDTCELDEIQEDEIKWDDRSDLDINAAPYQFHQGQDFTSEAIPENCIGHFFPETNSTQQSEPDFDLKNYSAKDVDNWASTLSADEFEHLRIMGPNARTESFRQYATLHIDQSTRPHSLLNSLPPQSNQALHNQNIYPTTNEISNHCIPSHHVEHHPDQFNPSNYCEHSNYCASDLDENPENKSFLDDSSFNGVVDDSGFDDGEYNNCGFDNGGFDDGGFDDGGFDDGGFDDGGFDDGGFDDGGFDDSGFDNGGFDDGYGSSYY
ncbi:hypothetical protein PGT21_016513 [Puccinia graminis f. sp. tritici]|uniref:Uncharacterized protein n=1 Tax=Puccinia graminis f. sp. tritici TaxID=56615 RepID=A0A5B0PU30_PUCGR|nr:hypothetical protein PGTUg99_035770 [Puccinia graminis f. sp. tritici]KAA1104253.1 hypothetical protein PGT21_016513 [Puccinia graminis f. sp. tritici]